MFSKSSLRELLKLIFLGVSRDLGGWAASVLSLAALAALKEREGGTAGQPVVRTTFRPVTVV